MPLRFCAEFPEGLVFIARQMLRGLGKLQIQIAFPVAGAFDPLGNELAQLIHAPFGFAKTFFGHLHGFVLLAGFPVEVGKVVVVGAQSHFLAT